MEHFDITIIGGSAAGSAAAAQARRINNNAKIAIFEAGNHVSCSTCALPYYLSGMISDYRELISRTREQFKERENIDVFTNHRVEKIKTSKKQLHIKDLVNNREIVSNYSKLIIATGAKPLIPPVIKSENTFVLRNLQDCLKINSYIVETHPQKIVIVGGGVISLQLSEAFKNRFLDVTIIENKERIINDFSALISEKVEKYLKKKGIKVYTQENLIELECRSEKAISLNTKNISIPADMIIFTTGIEPDVSLSKEAGITTGTTGAIRTNEYTETNIPDIFAAGNCAEATHLITGRPVWIPLGTISNKQGKVAGTNVAGKRDFFSPVVGTKIVKTFDLTIGKTGLSSREAKEYGYKIISDFYEGFDRATYYPGASIIGMELIANRVNKKILGAQLIGEAGVDKRLDVMATAITSEMTLDQFRRIDLSYSCPFSTVIDFSARAAYNLSSKKESGGQ